MKSARRSTLWLFHDHLKWYPWNRTHTRRWRLWEWEQELKHSHSSQKSAMNIPHINERIYPSIPITPLTTAEQLPVHSPWRLRCCSPVHHHLVFSSSDEESPVRPSDPSLWHSSTPDSSPVYRGAEPPLPVQHHMNHHHMSPPSIDQFFKDDTTPKIFPQFH